MVSDLPDQQVKRRDGDNEEDSLSQRVEGCANRRIGQLMVVMKKHGT
jgi:hypothetical protein